MNNGTYIDKVATFDHKVVEENITRRTVAISSLQLSTRNRIACDSGMLCKFTEVIGSKTGLMFSESGVLIQLSQFYRMYPLSA